MLVSVAFVVVSYTGIVLCRTPTMILAGAATATAAAAYSVRQESDRQTSVRAVKCEAGTESPTAVLVAPNTRGKDARKKGQTAFISNECSATEVQVHRCMSKSCEGGEGRFTNKQTAPLLLCDGVGRVTTDSVRTSELL